MNSFTPAAAGRAGAGFQDIKAGTGNIFRAAVNRSRPWLLAPLVILIALSASPAHANGVSTEIGNGQTVTGTLIGSGSDTYSFNVAAGGSFVVSISESGFHDPSFLPSIDLTGPSNDDRSGTGSPLYAKLQQINATAGNWTVKVSRGDAGGDSGGSYALTLVQVPVADGESVGKAISGGSASGSISRGGVDVRTFKGAPGHTATLTIDGGTNGFAPDITVFTPTGGLADGFGCGPGCSHDVSLKEDGVYTVLVSKSDSNDVTGDYTLSVK